MSSSLHCWVPRKDPGPLPSLWWSSNQVGARSALQFKVQTLPQCIFERSKVLSFQFAALTLCMYYLFICKGHVQCTAPLFAKVPNFSEELVYFGSPAANYCWDNTSKRKSILFYKLFELFSRFAFNYMAVLNIVTVSHIPNVGNKVRTCQSHEEQPADQLSKSCFFFT